MISIDFEAGSAYESKQQVSVELWDVSGHQQYERCWPAIQDKADGVVLLYNPDNRSHAGEIGLWFEYFVQKAGMTPKQVMVFAHRKMTRVGDDADFEPPSMFRKCKVVETDWDSEHEVRNGFSEFIRAVL